MELEDQGRAIVYSTTTHLSTNQVKGLFASIKPDKLSTAPPKTVSNESIYIYRFSPDVDVFGNISVTYWSSNNLLWRCHGVKVVENRDVPNKYCLEARYYHSTKIEGWSKRVYLQKTSSSNLLLVHYKFSERNHSYRYNYKSKSKSNTSIEDQTANLYDEKEISTSIDQIHNNSVEIIHDNFEESLADSKGNDSENVYSDQILSSNMNKYYFAKKVDDILQYFKEQKCPFCINIETECRQSFANHIQSRHFKTAVFCEIKGRQACVIPCRKHCYYRKNGYNDYMRPHFHCPTCGVVFSRRFSFQQHLTTFQGNCSSRGRGIGRRPSKLKMLKIVGTPKGDHDSYSAREPLDEQPQQNPPPRNRYSYRGSRRKDALPEPQASTSEDRNADPDVAASVQQQTIEVLTNEYEASYSSDSTPRAADDVSGDIEMQVEDDWCETDTDDSAFLWSLLPDLRLMNPKQKNRFKELTLSLVEEVLCDDLNSDKS